MNCLHSRRLLLAEPRVRESLHRQHVAGCRRCALLAQQLETLGHLVEDAALAPVPAALAERVLVAHRSPALWRHAAAAAVAIVAVGAGLAGLANISTPKTVQAVGPAHPAVAAIAEVIQEQDQPADSGRARALTARGLDRLGLALKSGGVNVYYLGKCGIEASCEHIIVSTPEVHANVMLLPDHPLRERVLVEGNRMVALMTPAGLGGYIVVASSRTAAQRAEKLFIKG